MVPRGGEEVVLVVVGVMMRWGCGGRCGGSVASLGVLAGGVLVVGVAALSGTAGAEGDEKDEDDDDEDESGAYPKGGGDEGRHG